MRNPDRDLDPGPARLLPGVVQTVDEAACTATFLLPTVDDGSHRHGPADYTPKALVVGGEVVVRHPKRGTECLVVEDVEDRQWINQWAL